MVTTRHRGVFFGYTDQDELGEGDSLEVESMRMCIYWSRAMRGVLGLAQQGPDSDCRVGPRVEGTSRLFGVTGIFPVAEAAKERWESAPWT